MWSARRKPTAPVRHRHWCYYNQQGRQEDWKPLFLYRQVESEAIRLLLPVSTFQAETKLATFKACLELGLRKKFKGNPGHLIIREQQDPGTGGDPMPRRFLVLYDTVPGGTGYLKEFARNPEAMREVLEGAFRTLKSCRCRQRAGRRWLLPLRLRLPAAERTGTGVEGTGHRDAGRDPGPLGQTSAGAVPLAGAGARPADRERTGGPVPDHAGSPPEKAARPWSKLLRSGKWCFDLQADGGKPWLLEPQVDLTASEGVPVPCRPDFVLWPQGEQPRCPARGHLHGRICISRPARRASAALGDDIRKRMGLVRSGRFVVWSLTWDDVEEFAKDEELPGVGLLLDLGIDRNRLRMVLTKATIAFAGGLHRWSGLESLLRYLARPEPEQWRKAVGRRPAGVHAAGSRIQPVAESTRTGCNHRWPSGCGRMPW